MKRHLKRHQVPKNWPVPRKGTTFVVKPNSDLDSGVPILIAMRDMLKATQNRREVKKAIHEKNILLNNKPARNEKQSVVLFDTLTIVPMKKSYRMGLTSNGKFKLEETKEANIKVARVVNKKTLKGKKTQLNLSDGKNYLSELKCDTNDSVLIDFKTNNVTECLKMKEKSNVIIFAGKHAGTQGVISKINPERKMAEINMGEKNINVLIKQFMVVQ